MSKYGNWHTRAHKKPVAIPVPNLGLHGGMPVEWLNQCKEVHKKFGRDGLLSFFRETERRDGVLVGSLDILLPLFGEPEGRDRRRSWVFPKGAPLT